MPAPIVGMLAKAAIQAAIPAVIQRLRANPNAKEADLVELAMPVAHAAAERAVPAGSVAAPVKPAMASKINWTAGGAAVAALIAFFGFDLTPEQHAAIATLITVFGGGAVMILRTWFTRAITRGSKR